MELFCNIFFYRDVDRLMEIKLISNSLKKENKSQEALFYPLS